ncbi:sulfite exporter TauE/SafE family protein [Lutibacter sp. HS1-25]|uniref:sulfite exporter TauE/SafE family protein n=1 Tax=Lutibacter sp. HS1-25 TaxID=2485000 RepID=UPI001012BEC9|nr:sulfite exporter TauE/SafE family protein [Lutibacter sp. HS1-25]RXP45606.1 sulfite exporter TauE/SafE family protein [Lutibacter sp. HS1-25]
MDFTIEIVVLILVGFIAGTINTIAGGGSLLTLPILIFLGLPPNIANGTNRIGILFQNIFTTAGFKSRGVVTFPFSIYVGISALFGAVLGAQIAVDIKGEAFNKILAVIMVLVVILMVLKPKAKNLIKIEKTTGKYLWLSIFLFFFVGVYGGFIQAGVGFIMLFILSTVNNISLVKSNAIKVTVALIYTVSAVVVFAYNDTIDWQKGLILAIGNASGGWFASRWSVKKGDRLVKNFLIIMVVVFAIKLWFF